MLGLLLLLWAPWKSHHSKLEASLVSPLRPCLPIGRSRISSSTGVYCCPQPGSGSCQHPAEGARRCPLVTTSLLAGAVPSQSSGKGSKHLRHQGTMVLLPAEDQGSWRGHTHFPMSPSLRG